jgi:DNA-binding CsgD family transcriptional regulator
MVASSELMKVPPERGEAGQLNVSVLGAPGLLVGALALGLAALGWQVALASGGVLGARVVLAVEDHADGLTGVLRELESRTVARLVLVGGLGCLPTLTRIAASLSVTGAVNADLPYVEVIPRVDAELRSRTPTSTAYQELQRRLRKRRAESSRFQRLTDRESAVLADLVAGRSATEIARDRPVSLATVRSQIAAVLRKLEVPSQTAAIALAYRACHDPRVIAALRFHQNY